MLLTKNGLTPDFTRQLLTYLNGHTALTPVGSLHGTLNHLLLTDRLWLKRLSGEGDHPNDLNAILYEDRMELTKARIALDNRLIEVMSTYDDTALSGLHSYRTTSGMPKAQVLADTLLHLFNHQTHHRGQAHA